MFLFFYFTSLFWAAAITHDFIAKDFSFMGVPFDSFMGTASFLTTIHIYFCKGR